MLHGDFLANQIAAHPLLLDELLDERLLLSCRPARSLARELDVTMEQRVEDDPERQVETLRHFQRAAIFRIAVADLTGVLPVMQVSDRLTDVAELIVDRAISLAWQQITAQFGVPMCGEGAGGARANLRSRLRQARAAWSFGYSSDLDLVFLHDSHGEQQETAAHAPIDNQVFFITHSHSAERAEPVPGDARGSAAVLPDAADVPVELDPRVYLPIEQSGWRSAPTAAPSTRFSNSCGPSAPRVHR